MRIGEWGNGEEDVKEELQWAEQHLFLFLFPRMQHLSMIGVCVCLCARVSTHCPRLQSSHTIFISEESDDRQLVNVPQQKSG